MADSPYVFEATAQTFSQILAQHPQTPVFIDFWADWCQPCKTLAPLLEKLANEYQGSFIVVKIDTENPQNKALISQLGIRSLPTVKIVLGGKIIDEFSGALPEPELRKIINKHRVRLTEPYRQQALAMEASGDWEGAIDLMMQVVEREPDFYEAMVELSGMLLQVGRLDEAETFAKQVPAGAILSEVMQALQAELKLARLRLEAGGDDTSGLEQRLTANANDLEALLQLAKIRVAQGEIEQGLAMYLQVMQKDRSFGEDAGRKGLISTFEMLGANDPLVKKYRNKMFSLLY
ncbi:tetratricopeptide repeat protein [Thiolinea disciformis]|uniref:tetratricopeptide repeat protein n=1 Tax=Thiolinea disciformis TaxID=125614 RepID=UPI00037991D3|nr:tetratricopeptide repeat protein [Thiolinea disciformis]